MGLIIIMFDYLKKFINLLLIGFKNEKFEKIRKK